MNYYEIRYKLFDNSNKSKGKFSCHVRAKNKNSAINKLSNKIGEHSILYVIEISHTQFIEWVPAGYSVEMYTDGQRYFADNTLIT